MGLTGARMIEAYIREGLREDGNLGKEGKGRASPPCSNGLPRFIFVYFYNYTQVHL